MWTENQTVDLKDLDAATDVWLKATCNLINAEADKANANKVLTKAMNLRDVAAKEEQSAWAVVLQLRKKCSPTITEQKETTL